jgi:hypothetical protein
LCSSDGLGELGERSSEPQMSFGFGGEFVVSTADVLDEGVSGADGLGGSEAFESFPIGYAVAVAAATGAFVNPDPTFLQSTGFVLDPGGKVWSASTPAERSAGWCPTTSSG